MICRGALAALGALFALHGALPAAPVIENEGIVFLAAQPALPRERAEAIDPLVCLRVALAAQGFEADLPTLRALSGEAWAPLLHVAAPVFEPLRDRQPLDVLTRACEAVGARGAWRTDLDRASALSVIADEIRAGRPVLASFLHRPEDDEKGWNLILGVDQPGAHVMIAEVGVARREMVLSIPEGWDGPVPGPAMWVDTPLFTADASSARLPDDAAQLRLAMSAWRDQVGIAELSLPDHAGARRYSETPPGALTALAGPAAARALADEIESLESLDHFPTIWRVRALLPLFAERREAGAEFLRGLEGLSAGEAARCQSLAASLEAAAETARSIASLMWNTSLLSIHDAQDMLERIRIDPPLLVDLSEMPGHERTLLVETIARWPQPWDMAMHATPFGPAMLVDSPEQRARASGLLNQLADQMQALDDAVRE